MALECRARGGVRLVCPLQLSLHARPRPTRRTLLFLVMGVFSCIFAVCAAAGLTPLLEAVLVFRSWTIAALRAA